MMSRTLEAYYYYYIIIIKQRLHQIRSDACLKTVGGFIHQCIISTFFWLVRDTEACPIVPAICFKTYPPENVCFPVWFEL